MKKLWKFAKAGLEEVGEKINEEAPDTAVILLGRGGSDPDANSDLYKNNTATMGESLTINLLNLLLWV